MRLTVFWERMTDHFGPGYADTFARDHVMTELGGRTVHEALDSRLGREGRVARGVHRHERAAGTAVTVHEDRRTGLSCRWRGRDLLRGIH